MARPAHAGSSRRRETWTTSPAGRVECHPGKPQSGLSGTSGRQIPDRRWRAFRDDTGGANMTTLLAPGGKLDERATVTPVRIAVLTISDTRDEESDTSGAVLVERLAGAGHVLAAKAVVRDDIEQIRAQVKTWTGSGDVDVILTTGGTGITGRDVTPEAVEPL